MPITPPQEATVVLESPFAVEVVVSVGPGPAPAAPAPGAVESLAQRVSEYAAAGAAPALAALAAGLLEIAPASALRRYARSAFGYPGAQALADLQARVAEQAEAGAAPALAALAADLLELVPLDALTDYAERSNPTEEN
jgi:hypothetical protein